MLPARIAQFTRGYIATQRPRCAAAAVRASPRFFSGSSAQLQSITLQVQGTGTGTKQTVSVKGKPYTFPTDTYTVLGGSDSAPSPVAYSLASLGSCNQVTGFVVARDHGITLGEWQVTVEGVLPTAVLVQGEQGNPNWESVVLSVQVQTDIKGGSESAEFQHFISEVDRRCPITQLFKRSGVVVTSEWTNLPL